MDKRFMDACKERFTVETEQHLAKKKAQQRFEMVNSVARGWNYNTHYYIQEDKYSYTKEEHSQMIIEQADAILKQLNKE